MRGIVAVLILVAVIIGALWIIKSGGEKTSGDIQAFDTVKSRLTRTNMIALEREVQTFIIEKNRLPRGLKEIGRSIPAAAALQDGWGKSIRFKALSGFSFRLISAGEDGIFGTEDDISHDSHF